LKCDWVGCHEDWKYKVYYDDVPLFYFCKRHYLPAIDFVLRDICPIASESIGDRYPYSVNQYKKDTLMKNQMLLLEKEEKLKSAIKRNDNTISRRRAIKELERKKDEFDEARRVLSL